MIGMHTAISFWNQLSIARSSVPSNPELYGCFRQNLRVRHARNSSKAPQVLVHNTKEGPYEQVVLPPAQRESSIRRQSHWLAAHIKLWADEEWTPLAVHDSLANSAAEAYAVQRRGGQDELGDILLGITQELQSFDFHDTFTSAFEVANKVAELLMEKEGREVCCQSDEDKERYARGEAEFGDLNPGL